MKWGIALFLASLAVLTAKKSRHRDKDSMTKTVSVLEDGVWSVRPSGFNFNGTLRKSFALHAFLARPEKSLVCSPVSALLPLGKLVLGTERGDSRKELLEAIGATKSQVKKQFKSLLKELQFLPGVTLSVASRVYIYKDYPISPSYKKLAESVFQSSCEPLDLKSPVTSAALVNKWVNFQTKGMIPEIVSPSDITMASALIVNAVYFAGLWKEPFKRVAVGDFYAPQGVRQIPMMTLESTFNYGTSKTLGSQIIEIPYANEKASFVVVLPEARSGLTLVLQQLKLAPELLNQAMEDMHPTSVRLTIPKFKVHSEMDLIMLYNKIGLQSIFGLKSGITQISEGNTLILARAVQKCVIEVSEKGTKASAATGIVNLSRKAFKGYITLTIISDETAGTAKFEILPVHLPPVMLVNRPFLYFVKVGKEQLFAGIFTHQ